METDNKLSGFAPSESVATSSDGAESSHDSNIAAQESIKNLKAEMNRKFSKTTNELKQELAEMKQLLIQNQGRNSAAEADTNSPDYKTYVDARLSEKNVADVRKGQEAAWSNALELFPELNQDSDSFDEKFYKAADKYYSSFDLTKDADAPLKAVKLAALEMGKVEQLAKEKILKDEARRSRIISEGSSTPRENKKKDSMSLNESNLARLGVKNFDRLKQRAKNYEKQLRGED